MITQVELDGFKTFKDFKVELAPFQVIVGPNGSGKSNLFDALRLLSRLAETDLQTAFQSPRDDPRKLRGNAYELFTLLPNGVRVERMRFAVEMLVDRKVQDEFGGEAELRHTRLRYEIGISLIKNQLYITFETLKSIPLKEDKWLKKYAPASFSNQLAKADKDLHAFITTSVAGPAVLRNTILILPENDHEGKTFFAEKLRRTAMSRVSSTDFSHIFAAREELRSLRFLHLNPDALRRPSPINTSPFLSPDGSNLPATLARMKEEDSFAFHMVSLDMANLVSGILKIHVEKNSASNEYEIFAETTDQRTFSAQVLSDGTLRSLALAAIRNDPQFHGVLCIEEPENGVQALYLDKIAELLRETATDFSDPEQANELLRQVIVTTHSPLFISQPGVIDSLLLATMPARTQGKNAPSLHITRMDPVITPNTPSTSEMNTDRDIAVEAYTIDMVRKYLDDEALDEAQEHLEKARMYLDKR